MQKIIALLAFFMIALGAYWQFYYPPNVARHETARVLQQFSDTVESKDRAKIGEALKNLLADSAKIQLQITFFSIVQQAPAITQDFDNANFAAFVDNILYTLTDYSYVPKLENFTLAADGASAAVVFSSKEWGDGTSYYGGTPVAMRFSSMDTLCSGQVSFKPVKFTQLTCKLTLMTVPKPGEEGKIQSNPAALQKLLQQ